MDILQIKQKADELLKKAHESLKNKNAGTAFKEFDEAANLYKKIGRHDEAAKAFASAATSWDIKIGGEVLFNAASRYQYAAEEAMKHKDYRYAKYLYHTAARFYERDGFTKWFSHCFYMSKLCDGKYSECIAFEKEQKSIIGEGHSHSLRNRFGHFCTWLLNIIFKKLWGYGEKPWRVIIIAILIIVLSSFVFFLSNSLVYLEQMLNPSYFDSLYFSVVTFTTLGYGDYHPTGLVRIVSMIEACSSLILMPLFIISLTRKYLRTFY